MRPMQGRGPLTDAIGFRHYDRHDELRAEQQRRGRSHSADPATHALTRVGPAARDRRSHRRRGVLGASARAGTAQTGHRFGKTPRAVKHGTGNLAPGVAALFLIIGAYFTWRQLQLRSEQLRQTFKTIGAQLQRAQDGQLADQFGRALEYLRHERTGVRVRRYLRFRISGPAPATMRPAVHELLAAYLRTTSTWQHHDPSPLALSTRPISPIRRS
jgi:hypothetical protein